MKLGSIRQGLAAVVAAGILTIIGAAQAAPPSASNPGVLADRMVAAISLTNNTGRAYDVEGIYFKTLSNTTSNNTITLYVKNTQDTGTTNVVNASITYTVKALDAFTDSTNWLADELIRVPDAAVLYIANGASPALTNDFVVFRKNSE